MFSNPGSVTHLTLVLVFKAKLDWITLIHIHTFSDSQIWITSALRSP